MDEIILKIILYIGIEELKKRVSLEASLKLNDLKEYIKGATITIKEK